MSVSLVKFVAAFDIHCGWERVRQGNAWVTRTVHDERAIKCFTAFLADFKPDYLVLGGDQLNFGPISHWNRGKPVLVEGIRLKAEYDIFQKLIMEPAHRYCKEHYWLDGNHERWIYDLVAEKPGLEGLIEPAAYLKLTECGWTHIEQGGSVKIGKLHFMHGDTLRYGGKYPAKEYVSRYRRNLRIGHFHTYQAATDLAAVDAKDYHDCVIVPPMCRPHLGYALGLPMSAQQGFLYGYVDKNTGNFNDYVVKIHQGKAFVEGKVYGG